MMNHITSNDEEAEAESEVLVGQGPFLASSTLIRKEVKASLHVLF